MMEGTPTTPGAAAAGAQGLWAGALLLVYALSGLTGLSYEVLWARMLGVQFGVTLFGVVITVSAFMAGLGLGSLLGVRWARHCRRPLLWFALLEAGIALYALALPWALQVFESWLTQAGAGLIARHWFGLNAAAMMGLMLLPATAMGIGFPLVLVAAERRGITLGAVYGINACGAALGALLPLYLLPAMGWSEALQWVASLGLVIGLAAAALVWTAVPGDDGGEADPRRGPGIPVASLLAYAGVGAAALMIEIGWTRLFGMVLLRTEYVLALILAVFLVGMGLGSLAARSLRHPLWLALLPAAAAITVLLSLWCLPLLSAWAERAVFDALGSALAWQGLAIAALTLPATLVLGAWLPLLTRRLRGRHAHGARLYAVNSLGAALGAMVAGFVLLPALGTYATIALAALLLFALGMVWSPYRSAWIAGVVLLGLAWPVREMPAVHRLMPAAYAGSVDLYRYEDAIAINHVVERADGQRLLLTDLQRMDASSDPAAVALQENQARLPLLLHGAPQRVLFLGLGTGITAGASFDFDIDRRVAVELSQGAITAAGRWFESVNHRAPQRMEILRDDLRNYLRTTDRRYSVIVGDVFHPDLVGRSTLLSVQQFRRVRERLEPGGLYGQWLALNQFDRESLLTILRSFQRVFPDMRLFVDGFRLLLVGPRDGFRGGDSLLARLGRAGTDTASPAAGEEGAWTWMGRYWGRVTLPEGPVQEEWRPHIEFALPRVRYSRDPELVLLLEWLLRQRAPLSEGVGLFALEPEAAERLKRAYIATELGMRSWLAQLQGDTDEAHRLIRYAYEANPRDRWIGYTLSDGMLASLGFAYRRGLDKRQALEAVLAIRPDHLEALRELWRLERAGGNDERARAILARIAAISPLDRLVRSGAAAP